MKRRDDLLARAEALELYEQHFGVQVEETALDPERDATEQLLHAIETGKEILYYSLDT